MKRRGGVSASVISEADATSYVKKVKYSNTYNNISVLVTIVQPTENAASNLFTEIKLTFLGCPQRL